MHVSRRDIVATCLVAASVVYALWLTGTSIPGLSDTRVSGSVILALGFAASASAVVPGFEGLLQGNKLYLIGTSVLGLIAAVAGVLMLLTGSGASLAVVMVGMVVLWLLATVHHSMLAAAPTRTGRPGTAHG